MRLQRADAATRRARSRRARSARVQAGTLVAHVADAVSGALDLGPVLPGLRARRRRGKFGRRRYLPCLYHVTVPARGGALDLPLGHDHSTNATPAGAGSRSALHVRGGPSRSIGPTHGRRVVERIIGINTRPQTSRELVWCLLVPYQTARHRGISRYLCGVRLTYCVSSRWLALYPDTHSGEPLQHSPLYTLLCFSLLIGAYVVFDQANSQKTSSD